MRRTIQPRDDASSKSLQPIIQALRVPSTCPEFPTAARSRLRFPLRSCRACGRNSWRRGEICTWRSFQQRWPGGKISNGRVSGPGSRCPHGRCWRPLIAVAAELRSAGSRSAPPARPWRHGAIQAPSRAILQLRVSNPRLQLWLGWKIRTGILLDGLVGRYAAWRQPVGR